MHAHPWAYAQFDAHHAEELQASVNNGRAAFHSKSAIW